MSENKANDEEKKKKPYVKPVLDSAIIYEASGTTCCKLSIGACDLSAKASMGKASRPATGS